MRKFDARQVPEQDAVRMQRALGRTGRARCVDINAGSSVEVSTGVKYRGRTRERLEQAFGAVAGTVDREHQCGQRVRMSVQLRETLRVG